MYFQVVLAYIADIIIWQNFPNLNSTIGAILVFCCGVIGLVSARWEKTKKLSTIALVILSTFDTIHFAAKFHPKSMKEIILYDLAASNTSVRFSPYVWFVFRSMLGWVAGSCHTL